MAYRTDKQGVDVHIVVTKKGMHSNWGGQTTVTVSPQTGTLSLLCTCHMDDNGFLYSLYIHMRVTSAC